MATAANDKDSVNVLICMGFSVTCVPLKCALKCALSARAALSPVSVSLLFSVSVSLLVLTLAVALGLERVGVGLPPSPPELPTGPAGRAGHTRRLCVAFHCSDNVFSVTELMSAVGKSWARSTVMGAAAAPSST